MKQLSQKRLFEELLQQFGEQNWWPATEKGEEKPSYRKRKILSEKQKLEICFGALLAQNTNWKNAEKAITSLNRQKMIDCRKILKAKNEKIAELVRPSGYYNQKAKKLKNFCEHIEEKYGGRIEKLLEKELGELREELLLLNGIGEETADSIILYAAQKPSFVADAYTKRIASRYYGKEFRSYGETKGFFEKSMGKNTEKFNEMHALLVEHAKRHCRKKPECGECFLKKYCLWKS